MITVVGGGIGGYTAAIRAAQLGAEVTLVEKEDIGGLCLHWGCIPSKVFLKASKLYSQLKACESYGISVKPSPFDMRRLVEKKDEVKQSLVTGIKDVIRSYGITVVHGEGRISDENIVTVGDSVIPSEKIIIATGTRPDVPHLFQEMAVTSREVFQLSYLPRSVLIVYGGAFSVELAWFFLELGSQVSMLTGGLLEREFEDIENRIVTYLKGRGVKFLEGRISSIKKSGTQKAVGIGKEETLVEEVVWMKRERSLEGIPQNLVKEGIVPVNEHMQTAVPHMYAVGDITGSFMAGDAMAQGVVAAEHALGKNAVYVPKLIPKVLYAPEAAVVGLTEKEAEKGYEVVKGSFLYSASGRAQTVGAVQGRITIIADKKYGEILGAHMVGKGATELIHAVSFAMSVEATVEELSRILCAHPTLVEMIKDASLDIYGNAFNLPRK